MDSSKTIPAHKTAFLRSQIRLLSAILQPSSKWSTSTSTSSGSNGKKASTTSTDLPPKTVEIVLGKLNAHLDSHNRAVYSAQTQRHVAEQIDALYWSDVTRLGLDPPDPDEVVVGRDVDLSIPDGLDTLPIVYEDLFLIPMHHHQHHHHQHLGDAVQQERRDDTARYAALRARLSAAMAEQRRQRSRLEAYRQLAKLLKPFESAGEEVQPNLAGTDGELRRELDRMRGLIATVTGRIGELRGRGMAEREDEAVLGEMDKLRDVMDVL